jgi:TPR repeat protein
MRSVVRLLPALAVLLLAGTASAQTAEDGNAILRRGDYETAFQIFARLAPTGDPIAQTNLGLMYSRGWGVPVNEAEAVKWYRMAANKEQPAAQNNLGIMYMAGKGGPKDIVIGLMWVMLAAENGHENAKKLLEQSKQDVTPREYDLARDFTVLYRKKWAIARKE